MLPDLLITKITMPRSEGFVIARQRLVQALRQNTRPLTLISASAGYGKTSLLQQSLLSGRLPFVWLSLDEGDNDIPRFWRYLIAAFQHQALDESLDAALAGFETITPTTAAELQDAFALLMNAFQAQSSGAVLLVFDDWHMIENPVIEQALAFLVAHLPPALRLIISSRIDPDLPLSRMRVQGGLFEVREQDLRLSIEESGAFLREMGAALTPAQVQALHERTEGWIAGLQLVALALQNVPDVPRFVEAFTGTHRYIMDYLLDEVFRKQPPHIQDFLLSTAVLPRMNAALCDAVCEINNSQAILESLEQHHLFVIPLDDQKRWYRYHHLFADLLRQGLKQHAGLSPQDLHLRASRWYAAFAQRNNDLSFNDIAIKDIDAINEALHHAVEAGEPAWLVTLLNRAADTLWEHSQLDTLQQALDHVPPDLLQNQPRLLVFRAWNDITHGRYDRAHTVLETAQHSPVEGHIAGRFAVCRAFIATFQHRLQDTIQEAQSALTHLTPSDAWYSSAAIALGDAYAILGYPEEAEEAYQTALQSTTGSRSHYSGLNAAFKLAGMQRQQGRLKEAFATCDHYLRQAEEHHLHRSAVAGVLYAMRGDIYTEWLQFDAAHADLRRGVEQNAHRSHIGFYGWANLYEVRHLIATGQYEDAEQRIQAVLRETPLPPWLKMPYQLVQVIGWVEAGNLQAAGHWLERLNLDLDAGVKAGMDGLYLIGVRVLQAQQRYDEAGHLLERVIGVLQPTRQRQSLMIASILMAVNARAQGDSSRALQALTEALHLGAAGQYLQSFASAGPELLPVLVEARQKNIEPDYVTRILSRIPQNPHDLLDPLSERELDVLRLIASGMKNQQIADELVISLNTVLYHTKNIYGKLGVSRRVQAIQKAQEIGLI